MTGNTEEVRFKTAASKKQASKLCFTENQATAILELRLSKLIGLEILSLQEDYKQTLHKIETYETILGSQHAMMKTIKQDLVKIKKTYGLPRKTEICNAAEAVFEEAPVVEQDVIFTMNRFGYVKMMEPSVFERNANCRTGRKPRHYSMPQYIQNLHFYGYRNHASAENDGGTLVPSKGQGDTD